MQSTEPPTKRPNLYGTSTFAATSTSNNNFYQKCLEFSKKTQTGFHSPAGTSLTEDADSSSIIELPLSKAQKTKYPPSCRVILAPSKTSDNNTDDETAVVIYGTVVRVVIDLDSEQRADIFQVASSNHKEMHFGEEQDLMYAPGTLLMWHNSDRDTDSVDNCDNGNPNSTQVRVLGSQQQLQQLQPVAITEPKSNNKKQVQAVAVAVQYTVQELTGDCAIHTNIDASRLIYCHCKQEGANKRLLVEPQPQPQPLPALLLGGIKKDLSLSSDTDDDDDDEKSTSSTSTSISISVSASEASESKQLIECIEPSSSNKTRNCFPNRFLKIARRPDHDLSLAVQVVKKQLLRTDPDEYAITEFHKITSHRCLDWHLGGQCVSTCPLSKDHVNLQNKEAIGLEAAFALALGKKGPIYIRSKRNQTIPILARQKSSSRKKKAAAAGKKAAVAGKKTTVGKKPATTTTSNKKKHTRRGGAKKRKHKIKQK